MGLLGGDGGCAAIRASGRHHGGWGGGGRVVTGDLAGDGAKLGHGDGTQAGALGHRGRRWGHYKRGEPVWAAFIFNLLYWTHHYTCSLCAQCPRFPSCLGQNFLHSSFFTIYLILVWAKGQKHGYEIYIFSKAICLRHFFHYYNVTEYTRVNLHPVSFLKKTKKKSIPTSNPDLKQNFAQFRVTCRRRGDTAALGTHLAPYWEERVWELLEGHWLHCLHCSPSHHCHHCCHCTESKGRVRGNQ